MQCFFTKPVQSVFFNSLNCNDSFAYSSDKGLRLIVKTVALENQCVVAICFSIDNCQTSTLWINQYLNTLVQKTTFYWKFISCFLTIVDLFYQQLFFVWFITMVSDLGWKFNERKSETSCSSKQFAESKRRDCCISL